MTALVRRVVVLGVLMIVASQATAARAASTAPDRIGLSLDGVTFGSSLPAPLFDPATRWVPGDTRSASFFVRNQSDGSADLSVDVLGSQTDSLLQTGSLTISARAGDGPWRDVTTTGTQRLVSEMVVGPGDRTRVDVTVALAATSPNASQTKQLDLDFRVVLTQDTGEVLPDPVGQVPGTGSLLPDPAGPPSGTGGLLPESTGLLPDTGAPALWSAVVGLALLAVGITVTLGRREKDDSHV